MPPCILLVLSDVINHVGDHHGEPAKHGDQHGIVSSLFREVAEVGVVGSVEEGPPCVLVQHRGLADDVVGRLVVGGHAPQHLLQRAVTVPGVVGNPGPGLQVVEGVFVHAFNPVIGQIQSLQGFCHPFKGMFIYKLNPVF